MNAISDRLTPSRMLGPEGWRRRRTLIGVGYALPTAIMVAVFFIVPLFLVVQMSASEWTLLAGDRGLNFPENYADLGSGRLFWPAVEFTIRYTLIVTVLLIALGLLMALAVQESGRWSGMLRTVFLLPLAVGLAAASLLFWGFYSSSIGPLNPMLQGAGLIESPISFLGTPTNALMSTVFLIVWKFAGFYMLILLVGLQSIPRDVYESAALDGAGRWSTFRHITLPLLRPALALSLILAVTGSLLAFDQFFLLTKGGPDNTTVTIVQLIYREAFQLQDLGRAAAISIVLLAALLALNALWFRGLRKPATE
jgi:multiple sugar transport system permease protein